jgi:hypothetical protein
MTVFVLGVVLAVAAAARSTWSPCGLSMLSQLTPLAEAGRGQRYARTATWFVAGATLGGLMLGGVMALGALLVQPLGITSSLAIALTALLALTAAAVDARVLGFGPPWLCRQVDEAWLAQYRPWVYAGGFGWQIGTGLTTYVMTAALPLVIVVGALTGSPAAALVVGTLFGGLRGCAVLLGRQIRTPDALYAAHRRFDAWTSPVRDAVIVGQLAVAVVAAWFVGPTGLAIAVSALGVVIGVRGIRPRRSALARPPRGGSRNRTCVEGLADPGLTTRLSRPASLKRE